MKTPKTPIEKFDIAAQQILKNSEKITSLFVFPEGLPFETEFTATHFLGILSQEYLAYMKHYFLYIKGMLLLIEENRLDEVSAFMLETDAKFTMLRG